MVYCLLFKEKKANDRIHKGQQLTRKEWLVAVLSLVKENCYRRNVEDEMD